MITTMSRNRLKIVMLLGFAAAAFIDAVFAQSVNSLQSQDTNIAGIVADLIECKREDGVMTIKLKLRNTTDQDIDIKLINSRRRRLKISKTI